MHAFANPAKFLRLARPLTAIFGIGGVLLIAFGSYAGLVMTPPDYLQGDSVRILYIHVPAAWLSMAGWSGIAIASLAQLVWRHPLSGVAARAIAVPGAMFTAIWGRPTWGTYWQWDGRMTSVLVLLFLYIGYIALASSSTGSSDGRGSVSRVTAIYGLVGAINLPIIKYSVQWWNTLHQAPSITLRGSAISSELLWPLGFTVLGFSFLFGAIVLMRMRAILAGAKVEARLARLAAA
jgi:heme exporter protein C